MDNLLQRDLRRVGITEHHHAKRIADQDDVDAAFIQQSRRWIIVGGQGGHLFPAPFHLAKVLHGSYQTFVRRDTLADSGSKASNSLTVFFCPGKVNSGRISASGASTKRR